ncbi:MAG: hypothetical protein EBU01_15870, partial [Crocinitomicaceae bacterium]|nr:hypothetical protein [Crocinitomicaceae bacterium]
DKSVTKLLKTNPFDKSTKPKLVKVELYKLSFSDNKNHNWNFKKMKIFKIFSSQAHCSNEIFTSKEIMKYSTSDN